MENMEYFSLKTVIQIKKESYVQNKCRNEQNPALQEMTCNNKTISTKNHTCKILISTYLRNNKDIR